MKSNQENTYEDLVNYFEFEKILKKLKLVHWSKIMASVGIKKRGKVYQY